MFQLSKLIVTQVNLEVKLNLKKEPDYVGRFKHPLLYEPPLLFFLEQLFIDK